MRLYFAGPGSPRKEILTIMTIEKDGREFFVYCDIIILAKVLMINQGGTKYEC